PPKLDDFGTYAERYAIAAANFYGFSGSVTKHEVNLVRFETKLLSGKLGSALHILGQSWLDALQDPNWVAQTILAHGALLGGAPTPRARAPRGRPSAPPWRTPSGPASWPGPAGRAAR